MAWSPNVDLLRQVCELLAHSRSAVGEEHQRALQMIEEHKKTPEFSMYLAFILAMLREGDVAADVRQLAGLLLKNSVRLHFPSWPDHVQAFIKAAALQGMSDPNEAIRGTAGTVVANVVAVTALEEWPELLSALCTMLGSGDRQVMLGALDALAKVCEDSPRELVERDKSHSLNVILPKLIHFMQHPELPFRKYALLCMNRLIPHEPQALALHMEPFLAMLAALTRDPNVTVRQYVCIALTRLFEQYLHALAPHLDSIIEFMLQATQSDDATLAKEACEFWSTFTECGSEVKPKLRAVIPRLVPLLLTNMRYEEDDDDVIEAMAADSDAPDRPEDLRPVFRRGQRSAAAGSGGAAAGSGGDGEDDDDDDADDDDGDDGDDDEGPVGAWSKRRSAAAALDNLALWFEDELLPTLLPALQAALNHPDWAARECALLALGAVAEGCPGMKEHMPTLLPFMQALAQDKHPLIRTIIMWTLSRYGEWVMATTRAAGAADGGPLRVVLETLLTGVVDRNKKVQQASCSALSALMETMPSELLAPYLLHIAQALSFAFKCYQARNRTYVYLALGTLADTMHSDMARPDVIALVMPPLIDRWHALEDEAPELVSLLECLTSMAQALGPAMADSTPVLFARCVRILETWLLLSGAAEHAEEEAPPMDVASVALDLVSGLLTGLPGAVEPLVARSNLLELMYHAMQDADPTLRQSALALLGDLSKCAFPLLRPTISGFVRACVENLGHGTTSVCNNACWALGELAVHDGATVRPHLAAVLEELLPLMLHDSEDDKDLRNLFENVTITLGRLALSCAPEVARHLHEFARRWCQIAQQLDDNLEKEHAFRGMCFLIRSNPAGIVSDFAEFCEAVASWRQAPPPDLKEMLQQILRGFRESAGAAWGELFASLDTTTRRTLREQYGI